MREAAAEQANSSHARAAPVVQALAALRTAVGAEFGGNELVDAEAKRAHSTPPHIHGAGLSFAPSIRATDVRH